MKTVGGQLGMLFTGLLLTVASAVPSTFQSAPRTASRSAAATQGAKNQHAKTAETDSAAGPFDLLLNDIDQDHDAESRLRRYVDLGNNGNAPAEIRKSALQKAGQLLNAKGAALADVRSAEEGSRNASPDWAKVEAMLQGALTAFPAPEIRGAAGNLLLLHAEEEIAGGDLPAAGTLIGRAQELGADGAAIQRARAHLDEKQNSWGGKAWAAIRKTVGTAWDWTWAHLWALAGILVAIWLFFKLRGNKKDYQFEPFIVVEQHAADAKDKIYPGLTARLLKEMRRVKQIHQGVSQKALDEVSDPLGNSVPINFTEYEPDLTSKIEQTPEISVGAVKLPVMSYMAIVLRVNTRRVRTYYEEFNRGSGTHLRLMAEMPGGCSLVVQARYEERAPQAASQATSQGPPPGFWRSLLFGNNHQAVSVAADPPQTPPSKADVLDRLITELACEIRFSWIKDEDTTERDLAYSRTGKVYRQFTMGLDAQHHAAQILQTARGNTTRMATAEQKLKEARGHYDQVVAAQHDHAAAYFCRAGISLQESQIVKRSPEYRPDTPQTTEEFLLPRPRTTIDDAIDDYRVSARLGRGHLRGLSYFNLANIFYRIHRCDAYEQALDYADRAEEAFNGRAENGDCEARELRRRVWLLKISILADRAPACALSSFKRGTPEGEIRQILSKYEQEDPAPAVSEYWRIRAKLETNAAWEFVETPGVGITPAKLEDVQRTFNNARTYAVQAIEIDPEVAENHNALGGALSGLLHFLEKMNLANTPEYAECRRATMAAYDRACALSVYEFFFYNRAMARDFMGGRATETNNDFRRACATIANSQRSSAALLEYSSFLAKEKLPLAAEFHRLAAGDTNFSDAQKELPQQPEAARASD